MTRRPTAALLAAAALLTACSGTPEPAAQEGGGAVPPPGSVLLGTVGTEDDPDAFEIALTTEDGEPVSELQAGDYTIEVTDPSASHNFHLVGGSVDETTSVRDTEEVTWEVTFEEGEYTYRCDPHPSMTGSLTVTA